MTTLIGFIPNISVSEVDGRVVHAIPPADIFGSGAETTGAEPLPNFADGDAGFGLWFYAPDVYFYGRTGDGTGVGNEAGDVYEVNVTADDGSGPITTWLEISVPDPALGETRPGWRTNVLDAGAISGSAGTLIADLTVGMSGGRAPYTWTVWAGDPTMMAEGSTPTFRIDSDGKLRLHWPSEDYSGDSFSVYIGVTDSDGIHGWRRFDFTLTATAESDPGPPAGWSLPREIPDPTGSGTARPLIDGMGHSSFIDSRAMIR